MKIVVAKKADSLYPIVSAASIFAKVTRDKILDSWTFIEKGLDESISKEWGSGYPSDPNTVAWLADVIDPVFGFPRIVRFSWSTCETLMDKHCAKVTWDDEIESKEGNDIRKYFKKKRSHDEQEEQVDVGKEREIWVADMIGMNYITEFVLS